MPQKYSKQSEKIQELLKRIETGSKEVFTSENYRNFLSTMSKFHRYSVRNCILISMQKPNATYVAGFHAWQKNFHRHVKKGEKGIQILGYMPQEQTIKTIIHEIAHAVVHAPQSDLPPDQKPDRQRCEVQAESIAFIVCNYLNIDSSEYTFPYIASWSSDYELKELQDSLQTIQTAANELIGQISSEIDKLQVQQKEPEHAKPLSLNERIAAAKDAAKKYNLERSLTTPEKENFNELECTASNI